MVKIVIGLLAFILALPSPKARAEQSVDARTPATESGFDDEDDASPEKFDLLPLEPQPERLETNELSTQKTQKRGKTLEPEKRKSVESAIRNDQKLGPSRPIFDWEKYRHKSLVPHPYAEKGLIRINRKRNYFYRRSCLASTCNWPKLGLDFFKRLHPIHFGRSTKNGNRIYGPSRTLEISSQVIFKCRK